MFEHKVATFYDEGKTNGFLYNIYVRDYKLIDIKINSVVHDGAIQNIYNVIYQEQ